MEERGSESSKSGRQERAASGTSRRSKKRSSRKSSAGMESWCEEGPISRNGVPQPAIDYRQMFWQQSAAPPPHIPPHNGQRLFAAMSDPSVCGYSAVPMAYTMEPVSVPPMYPVYQTVSRPNYRAYRGRPRRNVAQNHHAPPQNPTSMTNGYSSLQESRSNYCRPSTYQNGDYASLPPSANDDHINNCDELNSEHRRYSDPGLGPADSSHPVNSEDSDSGESGSSITTIGKNNKLVLSLVEQMTALRETNSQMFKELHETKSDLECLKSDLARLKHGASSDYQPGMLSDIVREMREANRVLDEAMITKVNAMVDEQNRQRTMEFEKLRDQLAKMTEEKEDSYRRIAKLEDEVASLKLNSNNEGREIAAFEEETLALRRELQEARASKNLAENHAAKCVSALARPITPVTFDTPCITSTPVRTDIQDIPDCSQVPARPARPSSTDSRAHLDQKKNPTENRARRDSTSSSPSEPIFCRVSLSTSPSSSSPSSPSNSSRNDDRDGNADEIDDEWRWKAAPASENFYRPDDDLEEPKTASSGRIQTIRELVENINAEMLGNAADNFVDVDATERLIIFRSRGQDRPGETAEEFVGKIGRSSVGRVDEDSEKSCDSSTRNSEKSCDSSTRNSDGSAGASSANEAPDVVDESSGDVGLVNANGSSGDCKTRRKRAITEVPDVIVVAGKPVVPKDLCSTRILTSRVLTTSRATYTTAYI